VASGWGRMLGETLAWQDPGRAAILGD
jgi:hypothetical protein